MIFNCFNFRSAFWRCRVLSSSSCWSKAWSCLSNTKFQRVVGDLNVLMIVIVDYISYKYTSNCIIFRIRVAKGTTSPLGRRACVQKTAAERKVEHDVKRHFSASLPHPVFWIGLVHVHPMNFAANYPNWMSNSVFSDNTRISWNEWKNKKKEKKWKMSSKRDHCNHCGSMMFNVSNRKWKCRWLKHIENLKMIVFVDKGFSKASRIFFPFSLRFSSPSPHFVLQRGFQHLRFTALGQRRRTQLLLHLLGRFVHAAFLM